MPGWLKQSTAVTVKIGPFVDSTDGTTAETALTIQKADVRLSKNGGNYAAASADQGASDAGAPHDELGDYDMSLDATDTNTLGRLRVLVKESGALVVWDEYMVLPANVWDSLFGADKLQVHADEITAGLITAAAIATGAIDADALAADAVAEIADGVWDEDATAHQTLGTFGAAIGDPSDFGNDSLFSHINALPAGNDIEQAVWNADLSLYGASSAGDVVENIKAKTDSLTFTTANRVDAQVFGMEANTVTATAMAADAIGSSEFAATAASEIATTVNAGAYTPNDIAGAVWTQLIAAYLPNAGTFAEAIDNINTKTAALPSDPADQSLIIAATNTILSDTNAILVDTGTTLPAQIAALNNLSAAQVNAEVVDALNVDTYAEPTGVPAATASLVAKIGRLHQIARNKIEVTATVKLYYNDADVALWKKALSDDGTTYTEAEATAP